MDWVLVCVYTNSLTVDGGTVEYCQLIVHFIGLFDLTVYLWMRFLTGQWDSVGFIGLFGLSVYLSMRSLTGQWGSDRSIALFGF